MKSPKISVVIPSFNKGKRINETLSSIFNQNYKDVEVIVMDGGSTDDTIKIIKKFAQKYPKRFFWLSKKDGGQLEAINNGMKKASGDILTYINADDVYLKNTFNLISAHFIEKPDATWFAGRAKVINEEGQETAKFVTWYKNLLFAINSYNLLLIVNYLMQPSIFLTKKLYKEYGPFTGTKDFITEYDLWLKIGKDKMPFVIKDELSKFRIESTTKTKTMSRELLKEDLKVVKKYTKNRLFLFLHHVHNFARILAINFV